jgi:hypothetical protein
MLPLIGAGIGLVGGIGKMLGRKKANKKMDQLLSQDPQYTANPIAGERLGLAQMLLNARMPGATNMERNIYAQQSNRINNVNNVATDASQALALGGAAVNQTSNQFQQLGMQEAQDYQRRFSNLSGAQEGMIAEGDKVYQDQIRRFNNLAQIRSMQNANNQANWGDIGNLGASLMNFGLSGGSFSDFLGKKQ